MILITLVFSKNKFLDSYIKASFLLPVCFISRALLTPSSNSCWIRLLLLSSLFMVHFIFKKWFFFIHHLWVWWYVCVCAQVCTTLAHVKVRGQLLTFSFHYGIQELNSGWQPCTASGSHFSSPQNCLFVWLVLSNNKRTETINKFFSMDRHM